MNTGGSRGLPLSLRSFHSITKFLIAALLLDLCVIGLSGFSVVAGLLRDDPAADPAGGVQVSAVHTSPSAAGSVPRVTVPVPGSPVPHVPVKARSEAAVRRPLPVNGTPGRTGKSRTAEKQVPGTAARARDAAPGRRRVRLDRMVSIAVNRRDRENGSYGVAGGTCEASVLASPSGPAGCLRLKYDVSDESSSAGYKEVLKGVGLRGYARLVFELKGATGRERFSVQLCSGGDVRRIPIEVFLPSGLPEDWQTVSIPIDTAPLAGRRECPDEWLAFVFQHDNGAPYTGSIYIRDIVFER